MATRRNANQALYDESGELLESPAMFPAIQPATAEDEPAESDEMALLEVLEQLGGTDEKAKVMVYRVTTDRRKPDAFLRRFTPAEFAVDGLETLQRIYGAGVYKISVYGSHGKLIKNPCISIETPPGFVPEGVQQKTPEPDQNALLLNAMQSGFARMGDVLAQALGQVAQRPAEGRGDFLRELVTYKELFAPQSGSGSSDANVMEMFIKGLEMGKGLGPRGESNDSDVLLGLLESFGKPLAEIALSGARTETPVPRPSIPARPLVQSPVHPAAQPPAQPAVQPPAQPPAQPAVQPPAQPPVQPQGQIAMPLPSASNIAIKQALNFLVGQAERGNDPQTYAFLVLDQLPEDTIRNLIDDPDWFGRLQSLHAGVAPYREWFAEMVSYIRADLTGEDIGGMSDESPDPASGD